MFVIRDEQMKAFDEMVESLFRFAPESCQAAGEDQVRKLVFLGVQKAESYGLTYRGPVEFFLEMMVLFGHAFDTDPQLPWATEILKSNQFLDQMARADFLHDKTLEYLAEVHGPEGSYLTLAFGSLAARARLPFHFSTNAALVDGMLAEMKAIHPQKFAYVGNQALRALIGKGIESASAYELPGARGIALVILAMFAFGYRFDTDPLYHRILNALTDPKVPESARRIRSLEERMLDYLHLGSRNDAGEL